MKKIVCFILLVVILFAGCRKAESSTSIESSKNSNIDLESQYASFLKAELAKLSDTLSKMNYVTLYQHISIQKEYDIDLKGIDISDDEDKCKLIEDKFNVSYFCYHNGELIGEYQGTVEPTGMSSYWDVGFEDEDANEAEVMISKNFNPYPRKPEILQSPYDEITKQNKILKEIKEKFKVAVLLENAAKIDLDNDGVSEYIIHAKDKPGESHYLCLLDGNQKIISYLLATTKNPNPYLFDFQEDMEIVDHNNDGTLEILVTLFQYEYYIYNNYVYDHGIFTGEYLNECSLNP